MAMQRSPTPSTTVRFRTPLPFKKQSNKALKALLLFLLFISGILTGAGGLAFTASNMHHQWL